MPPTLRINAGVWVRATLLDIPGKPRWSQSQFGGDWQTAVVHGVVQGGGPEEWDVLFDDGDLVTMHASDLALEAPAGPSSGPRKNRRVSFSVPEDSESDSDPYTPRRGELCPADGGGGGGDGGGGGSPARSGMSWEAPLMNLARAASRRSPRTKTQSQGQSDSPQGP